MLRQLPTQIIAATVGFWPINQGRAQSLILTEIQALPLLGIQSPAASVGSDACVLIWDESASGPFVRWCGSHTDTVGWHKGGTVAAAWKDGRVIALDSSYALRAFRDGVDSKPQP